MNEVGKYIFKGLNTDVEPRFLSPGDYIYMENGRVGSTQVGKLGAVENIKGNSQVSFTLPAGTNKCIGSYEDNTNWAMVYFVHNSNGDHTILKYDTLSDSITKIAEGSVLNFTALDYITGVSVMDNYIIWTDGINPIRYIDINNNNAAITEKSISLYPAPPVQAPVVARKTDSSVSTNLITNKNFQFAYRYVYPDGSKSVFSPLSILSKADFKPDLFDSNQNYVEVFVGINPDVNSSIDKVEVAFREGNIGFYKVYESIDHDGSSFYFANFYNDGIIETVDSAISSKLLENIPIQSNSLDVIENRLFVSKDIDGYDVDESTFSISLSSTTQSRTSDGMYFKEGGVYNVGVVFYDEFGRPSPVYGSQRISIPFLSTTEGAGLYSVNTFGPKINVTLSGTPPIWAHHYQIVVSSNQFHGAYAQFPTNPLYYVLDEFEGFNEDTSSTLFSSGGKIFHRDKPTAADQSGDTPATQIYLQVPGNIPLVPTTEYYVRFLNFDTDVQPVLEVIGDKMIIGTLGLSEFTSVPDSLFVEVFTIKESNDNFFYEIDARSDITNPGEAGRIFNQTAFLLDGDTHYVNFNRGNETNWAFSALKEDFTKLNVAQVDYDDIDYTLLLKSDGHVESPSSVFDRVSGSTAATADDTQADFATLFGGQGLITPTGITSGASWVLDYSKSANNFGRVNVKDQGSEQADLNSVIAYSNPYVDNSSISGFRTFNTLDEETLPTNRGPIKALKRVGDVLIAIHERETTTMYVGEGFIRQGADAILAKTDSVIGDDRELVGDFGTIYPESISVYKGMALFFDVNSGSIVRYTKAGLFPVSSNGMDNYFKAKAKEYEQHPDAIIHSGIDPFHDEYIITFGEIPSESIAAETWAFSISEERWTSKYSFTPEFYGSIGTKMFSMVDGNLWIHNENTLYNNFYGTQYQRSLKFVAIGENPSEVKTMQSIRLEGEDIYDYSDDTFVFAKFTTESGQETWLHGFNAKDKEQILSGPILFDRNTPLQPDGDSAMYYGDKMRGQNVTVEIITNTSTVSPLYFVNVLHKTSPPIYQ
jgi:hypothetical protein